MVKRVLLFALICVALFGTGQSRANVLDSVKFKSDVPIGVTVGKNFELTLTGYGQVHYEYTKEDGAESTNTFEVKRVILIGGVRVGKHLRGSVMVDVANNNANRRLQEYYLQWDVVPEFKLRVGQYKQPFMLENVYSPTTLGAVSITEGTRYMSGIGGDVLQGNMAGRDLGIMATGEAFKLNDGHRLLEYSLGVFNGSGVNMRDNNSTKDVIGMLKLRPVKPLMLTTSFIIGRGHALADSPYGDIVAGENYRRQRWSAGLEFKYGPLMLRSEYTRGRNGDIKSRAFYAEAWLRLYKGLELVANYDFLDRNTALSREEQELFPTYTETGNYTIGLQYWVWKRCRVASQYVYSDRTTGPDRHQWITQFQLAF